MADQACQVISEGSWKPPTSARADAARTRGTGRLLATLVGVGGGVAAGQGRTSDISAGGCFVETMFTKPVGLKVDIVLWLGEVKIGTHGVIASCTPLVGNGIQFLGMTPADRDQLTRFLENLQ